MFLVSMVNIPETGITLLDQQRQELSDLISELHETVTEGGPLYEEGLLLQSIYEAALGHFDQEETLFQDSGNPLTDAHVREHRNFEETVTRMLDRTRRGGASASPDAVAYLNDWLCHHVSEFDLSCSGVFEDRSVI